MKSFTDVPLRKSLAATAVCCLLLAAVGLVFGQTIRHGFVNYDDDSYVYENPNVLGGLSGRSVAWAFTNTDVQLWTPVTWLSLMLDADLFGGNAGGYHATNVLLHGITAVLLFLALCRMTGSLWPSAFAALLFAVHPLRAESVAWVTERKDVLSGFFFMLTIAAYAAYASRPFSLFRYSLVAAFFILGLMAKPMLVTLPFVLLLLDYWPLGRMSAATSDLHFNGKTRGRRKTFWRLVVEKIPLLAIVAAFCTITYFAQSTSLSHIEPFPVRWRIGNAMISYVTYLRHFFWPAKLAVSYPRLPLDLPWRDVCGSLAVLLGVTAAAVLGRRRYPYLLVGWLWYLGMLAPVIGLLQVGTASVADRFTYLPQIGFALMLAWGAAEWCGPSAWRARTMGFAAAATLACLMGAAYLQTSYWRNSKTLWLHSLDCNRRDGFAYGSLGMCFQQAGRIDDAVFCYRNAIAIRPDDAVCNNLGVILAGRGELAEAEKCFRKALGITPDYDEAHCNLGRILADRGRLDEAIDHFRQSLQANPNRAEVFQRLGDALHRQGKATEAAAAWDKATELRQRRTDSKK